MEYTADCWGERCNILLGAEMPTHLLIWRFASNPGAVIFTSAIVFWVELRTIGSTQNRLVFYLNLIKFNSCIVLFEHGMQVIRLVGLLEWTFIFNVLSVFVNTVDTPSCAEYHLLRKRRLRRTGSPPRYAIQPDAIGCVESRRYIVHCGHWSHAFRWLRPAEDAQYTDQGKNTRTHQ